jgi:flavin reductase (DIM6/NTAB) family NADH-FMN oxidoreductase RutF
MVDPSMTPVSVEVFRKALSHFATGVTVITVDHGDGQIHGMTANAFASVSLDPLLVLVCIGRNAHTHGLVHLQKRFGVNVLAEHQEELARYFAQVDQDPATARRLGVKFARTPRGTPMLQSSLAHLDCKLVEAHEAGDHTIFLGAVEQIETGEGDPLLFYRGQYRKLPKNEI